MKASRWRRFKDFIKACLGMCAEPGCHHSRMFMSRFCGVGWCTAKAIDNLHKKVTQKERGPVELEKPSRCSRCGQPVKMVGWRVNDGLETELVHCDTNEEACFAHPGSRGQVLDSTVHGGLVALLSKDVKDNGPLGFIVFDAPGSEFDFLTFYDEGEAIDKAEDLAQGEWEGNPDPDAPRPPRKKIYALWATEWPEQKHPTSE